MISQILVPTDGSVHAIAAVAWAGSLALKYQARLVLLHIITDGELGESVAAGIIRDAEQQARSTGVAKIGTVIEFGYPADVILDHAANLPADLIVMGRRGVGVLPELVLGSVSSKVLHSTRCACLIVH